MKKHQVLAIFLLTTFVLANIGHGLLDIMDKDHFQIELSDNLDTKEEKEQHQEQKLKSRFNVKLINTASTKNRVEEGMLTSVDLQSLFHPEIITPPPELA